MELLVHTTSNKCKVNKISLDYHPFLKKFSNFSELLLRKKIYLYICINMVGYVKEIDVKNHLLWVWQYA